MQCKTCDYRLWNLKSRQCPECGTPFRPSEFEFVPNSVRFCCPHCEQEYYGTGPKGHLVPQEFTCVKCGQHIAMDEMVLLPSEGLNEDQTRISVIPWLDSKLGRFKAWYQTVAGALIRPGRMIDALPMGSPTRRAWGFARINCVVSLLSVAPLMFMFAGFFGVMTKTGFPFATGAGSLGLTGTMLALFCLAVMLPLAIMLIGIALWALIAHGLLSASGKTAEGYGRTLQAICYSSGAHAVTGVPCFGVYVGCLWWIVSATVMVARSQRVSGWRATVAVATPSLGVITLAVTLFWMTVMYKLPMVSAGGAFSATTAPSTLQTMGDSQVALLVSQLVLEASKRNVRWPNHAIELILDSAGPTPSFIAYGSRSTAEKIPVADTTLARLMRLSTDEQRKVCQDAVRRLKDDWVAHRVGDFVFTYHGIKPFRPQDPELWVTILSPDPAQNTEPIASSRVYVGVAGITGKSTTRGIPCEQFGDRLAKQNELRAQFNLAPLPDPNTVLH